MGNIARHGLLTPPYPHNITSNTLQNVPPSQITFSWCAYPKYMAVGPNFYLSSQSICFVGFWVSYCGWFYTWQTWICSYVPKYSSQSYSFTISKCFLSFLVFSPELPPLLLILVSYLEREISGNAMIISVYKWKWWSNSIVFK